MFWNQYRFQTGLTLPAYSALQGWQMIAQFTNPIRAAHVTRPFPKVAAEPFRLFKDPSTKAGEYMSALLFRRGDVRQSSHVIEMVVDPKAVYGQLPLQGAPPNTISRLALISTVGTRVPAWPGAAFRGEYHADLSLTPDGTQQIATQDGAQTITSSTNTGQATEAMFATLRKVGIISADNRSNPTKGLFESDTGQIFLNTQIGTMQITTPMSQGGSLFAGDSGLQLPELSAKLNGTDGAVFAGSLTSQTLAKSPRILLLIVTDALNTRMRFKDDKRLTLVDPGVAPVLMRVSQADISLHNTAPGTSHLWALSANGARVEEIPVTDKDGILTAHIDTASLRNGPTPYFEIVRTAQ